MNQPPFPFQQPFINNCLEQRLIELEKQLIDINKKLEILINKNEKKFSEQDDNLYML